MKNIIQRRINFITEIDKLKSIYRETKLIDGTRRENDAEHSFHIALMAFILQDYVTEEIDILKVIKMLLIHDIVEIDAGDTFAYDIQANSDKKERELKAANRLFSIIDDEYGKELFDLWIEFEEIKTAESRFANGIDRLQPMLLNYYGDGGTWKTYNIPKEQVYKRLIPLKDISPELWNFAENFIEDYYNIEVQNETL